MEQEYTRIEGAKRSYANKDNQSVIKIFNEAEKAEIDDIMQKHNQLHDLIGAYLPGPFQKVDLVLLDGKKEVGVQMKFMEISTRDRLNHQMAEPYKLIMLMHFMVVLIDVFPFYSWNVQELVKCSHCVIMMSEGMMIRHPHLMVYPLLNCFTTIQRPHQAPPALRSFLRNTGLAMEYIGRHTLLTFARNTSRVLGNIREKFLIHHGQPDDIMKKKDMRKWLNKIPYNIHLDSKTLPKKYTGCRLYVNEDGTCKWAILQRSIDESLFELADLD